MNINTIEESVKLDKATPELWEALSLAQAKMSNATKDARNDHFKSSYSTLAQILDSVRPVFAGAGLGIVQCPTFDGTMLNVETIISHKTGGWISSRLSVIPGRADAQGLGSAITYCRRYALSAMAGISQADEDDDGQAARHDQRPAAAAKASPPPARKTAPGPTRKDMIEALRESYLAAGITCGDHAAELMRKASFLKPGETVGSMSPGDLRKAYDARALIFKTAAGPDLIIDDEPA